MVMPCRGQEDVFRVQKNLVPSILKFLDTKGFGDFIVICEEEIKDKLQTILSCLSSKLNIRFVLDSELIPDECELEPWHKQQLLKLFSHSLVKSEWILTLDSDCYFVRNSSVVDFISVESNAFTRLAGKTPEVQIWDSWWEASAKYLNMPEPDTYCFVTPFIFNKQVLSSLCSAYNVEEAIRNGCSEHTLYWTYLCNTHTYTDYYTGGLVAGGQAWSIDGGGAWGPDETLTTIIKKQFSSDHEYPMSLTQSNMGWFNGELISLIHDEIMNKG